MLISKSTPKKEMLKLGEKCSRCGNCCSFSSGFLAEDDISRIASFLRISEEKLKQKYLEEKEAFASKMLRPKLVKSRKPYGRCIFLSRKKTCSIHEAKPLYCSIGNCSKHGLEAVQWFMLNYAVNPQNPESVRQWHTFLTQNRPIPGGSLEEIVPDPQKLKSILSYEALR